MFQLRLKRFRLSHAGLGLTYAGIGYIGLFAAGYCNHIYWTHPMLQHAALTLYIVSVLFLAWRIYAKADKRGNNAALLMVGLEVISILGCIRYPVLFIPWIVLVPWIAAGKAHTSLKVIGGLLHLPAALLLLVILIVRVTVAQLTLAEVDSPDGRHIAWVKMINFGAAGGGTVGELGTRYGPFVRTKQLYTGPYREESKVEWEGDRYFTIDGFKVDSQSSKLAKDHS
ncbi:hypothetical protein [Paenibacillus physcomitrellae]|uniref:Uncharacterized protein n=1 Tax=Paenibacillus physcomitrellae TaxID=1619311 RepID=A0ABQ1GM68_9BACL|nr:hypothetical protein [Paenibacillus physcomitrellae]GGA46420.1 hypothetical protein GCM10010917_34660 [Paenibacillus physcomitrellae]